MALTPGVGQKNIERIAVDGGTLFVFTYDDDPSKNFELLIYHPPARKVDNLSLLSQAQMSAYLRLLKRPTDITLAAWTTATDAYLTEVDRMTRLLVV